MEPAKTTENGMYYMIRDGLVNYDKNETLIYGGSNQHQHSRFHDLGIPFFISKEGKKKRATKPFKMTDLDTTGALSDKAFEDLFDKIQASVKSLGTKKKNRK